MVHLLARLASTRLSEYVRVVDIQAIYAYETALAFGRMPKLWRHATLIYVGHAKADHFFHAIGPHQQFDAGVLKVDLTFRIRKRQNYTAVNKDGFEVDIIRREQGGDDRMRSNSALKMTISESPRRAAKVLLDSPGFTAVIVASNGSIARMNTVHPATFISFKRWMSTQKNREAMKRRRGGCRRVQCRNCLNNIRCGCR